MLRHLFVRVTSLTMLALMARSVEATIVTYNINSAFSGTVSQGVAPFLVIGIDDAVAPGFARLTIGAPGLSPTEYVRQINLNLDPSFDASALTFTNFQINSGTLLHPVVTRGNDALEADGGGLFDLQFDFSVSGGGFARRLNAGESFSLDFSGISGLNANSFNFLSIPPAVNGVQLVAAQIEGIGAIAVGDEGANGWHTVPEPATLSAVLLGSIGSLMRRRRISG